MKRLLKRLYYYYFFFCFISIFLLFFPLAYFYLKDPRKHRKAQKIRRVWAKMILFFVGVRYKVYGREKVDFNRTYVYTGNHTSPLDILLILANFPAYFGFMAKVEVSRIPLFGMFFRTIDLSVDRSSREKSALSYKKSIEALKGGKGLVIFPEGGILGTIPILQPFKDGAFDLAVRQQVAILPFTFPDNWKLIPDDGKKLGKPGKIRIILHKPLETAHLTKEDVGALRDQVFEIISEDMRKYK